MNERLKNMIRQYGSKQDFSGPVSEERIAQVERENDFQFPTQYREHIRMLGSGGIDGMEISGIESDDYASVIEDTDTYRNRGLEAEFIVIYPLDDYAMCMSVRDISENSPVYGWTVGSESVREEYDSFEEFLMTYFQDRIDNLEI